MLVAVLTVGTGSLDAMGFLRLGHVFASVMTGNIVQLGVAAGNGDGRLAVRVGAAVASFALGVRIGAAVAGPARSDDHDAQRRSAEQWPRRVSVALGLQLGPLGAFAAWWAASGGRPSPLDQPGLLALAAAAMGMQSAAVRAVAVSGMSSTYLTGTLTAAVGQLAHRGPVRWRGFAAIVGLLVGAVGGGLLTTRAAVVAPAIPLTAVTLVLAATAIRRASASAASAPMCGGGG